MSKKDLTKKTSEKSKYEDENISPLNSDIDSALANANKTASLGLGKGIDLDSALSNASKSALLGLGKEIDLDSALSNASKSALLQLRKGIDLDSVLSSVSKSAIFGFRKGIDLDSAFEEIQKVEDIFKKLNIFNEEIKNYNISMTGDSEITIDGQTIEKTEINKILDRSEEKIIGDIDNSPILDRLESNLDFARNTPVTKPQKIAMLIRIIILLTWFTYGCIQLENDYLNLDREEIETEGVDFTRKQHRVVKPETLNVRSNNSSDSIIIGSLNIGTNVKVLEEKELWTFIEYIDIKTQQSKYGWVFTEHLLEYE